MSVSSAFTDTANLHRDLPLGRDFVPHGLFRNGHAQTMLSSSSFRRMAQRELRRSLALGAQPVLLEVDGGVRLSGLFTPQRSRAASRGLAVLFHGWEGSTDSSYVVKISILHLSEK